MQTSITFFNTCFVFRCNLLKESRSLSLCCFGTGQSEPIADTVCVVDKSQHIHLDKHLISRFYVVNNGQFSKMEAGEAYNLQDITQ